MFVGQRTEGFAVNLGQIFDLVNIGVSALGVTPADSQADLTGAADQGKNIVDDKNVTTLALEIPASCLTKDASTRSSAAGRRRRCARRACSTRPPTFATPAREGGPWVQVSRLGMPLVNEVVIGLKDKDKFNGSEPKDDAPVRRLRHEPVAADPGRAACSAPPACSRRRRIPRADLVAAFLNGVPSVNVLSTTLYEVLRLNTAVPVDGRAHRRTPSAPRRASIRRPTTRTARR